MDILVSSLLTFIVLWTFLHFFRSSISTHRKSVKRPSGPYPFPIVGNLLRLGQFPHKSLAQLSKTYGPIMSIKMGAIDAIVVTSRLLAKEVLQTHDVSFRCRTIPAAAKTLGHDEVSLIWLPVAERWNKLRKVCKENMFSLSRLEGSKDLRRDKLQQLRQFVDECCRSGRVVDIGEAGFITSLNLMSTTMFSEDFADYKSNSSKKLKEIVQGAMNIVGTPNYADYFPIFKYFDLQGIERRTEFYFGKLLEMFDDFIDQRLKVRDGSNDSPVKNDLLNGLLESELSRHEIKHLILDLFTAGTDTSAGTVQWGMAELLRNPEKLSKAKIELEDVIGVHKQIEESDITRLPYLQAVIKETLRIHPPGPFLIPRKAEIDIEINGYLVPKHCHVFVNVWAIGRDPNLWSNPDSFEPERFLECTTDIKGHDFELLPFGAGRRICPGLPLAYRMVHLMLACLIHNFDWELEGGMKPEELDMTEKFGLALQKAVPLKAVPTKA